MAMPLCYGLEAPPLEVMKDQYNSNFEKVPGVVKSLLGTERINAYIALGDGTELKLSAITEKGMIKELNFGELENATLLIHTSEKTVAEIEQSNDSLLKLKEALDDGSIKYETARLSTRIKFALGSLFIRIASFFQRIFK
jgi:hypothetical protein